MRNRALMRKIRPMPFYPSAAPQPSSPPSPVPAPPESRRLRLAAESRDPRELLALGQPRPSEVLVQIQDHLERVATAQIRQRRLRFCKPDAGLDVPAGALADV